MKFEQTNFEAPKSNEDSPEETPVNMPAKRKPSFFKKAAAMAALGATIVGGRIEAGEGTNDVSSADKKPVAAEKASNSVEQITGSASWATNIVKKANEMKGEVKSKEEAMLFVKNAFGAFCVRFQNPDIGKGDAIVKGREEKKKFTEWDRAGTSADFRIISAEADELARIIAEVTEKQGIDKVNIQNETSMLNEISKKCADRAGQQSKQERVKKFEF